MKIELTSEDFGEYVHCLTYCSCANMVGEQKDRFVLLVGKACETGTIHFCHTFLEAVVFMKLKNGVGIYSDERSEDGGYCVVVP